MELLLEWSLAAGEDRALRPKVEGCLSSKRSNSNGSKASMLSRLASRTGSWKEPERRFERSLRAFEVSDSDKRSEAIDARGDAGAVWVL